MDVDDDADILKENDLEEVKASLCHSSTILSTQTTT